MRLMKNSFRVVAGLSLMLTFASVTGSQSGRGGLSGLVCSRVGNAGLANAKIELRSIETIARKEENVSTVADQYGRYEMAQITMGEYWLSISADGYQTYLTKVFIPSDGRLVWGTVLRK